jgi:hypothetical protein
MKSKVFFADMRANTKENIFDKLNLLLEKVDIKSRIKKNSLIAIKIHFGERGNTAFIHPVFVRKVIDRVKHYRGKPFLTDTNTLYRGDRSEAVSHLTVAIQHGFSYAVVDAPLVIADGIRGNTAVSVTISKPLFKEVLIGAELFHADGIISLAHFKGHELTGFGGTLKNLGMGGASRQGKLSQHSTISPLVDKKQCIGCGECRDICPQDAIYLTGKKSLIDSQKCIGCAECITFCSQGAIQIQWNETTSTFQKKMVEFAFGVLKGKEGRAVFLNFLMNISPACDCYSHADAPIVPNIGILSSIDPVAIDQASAELVNEQAGLKQSALKNALNKGEDKFRDLYPEVDWELQLDYAEQIGLGLRNYQLITV